MRNVLMVKEEKVLSFCLTFSGNLVSYISSHINPQVYITCDFPDAGLWLFTGGSNRDVLLVSGSSSMVTYRDINDELAYS